MSSAELVVLEDESVVYVCFEWVSYQLEVVVLVVSATASNL